MQYAICEIAGKQYKAVPGKDLLVPFVGENGDFECEKVLLIADDGKLEFGEPFLKKTLKFTVLGITKHKIRGAKFHAKANTRKVWGAKQIQSRIRLV
jgi:ribosomal protein L21